MKLLTEKQFLQCPVGTVFVKKCTWKDYADQLQIKGQSCGDTRFYMHAVIPRLECRSGIEESELFRDAEERPGEVELPLDLYTEGRDGYWTAEGDEAEYLVFTPEDVDALIERLQKARAGIDTYAKPEVGTETALQRQEGDSLEATFASIKAQGEIDAARQFQAQVKHGLRELKVFLEEDDCEGGIAYLNELLGES